MPEAIGPRTYLVGRILSALLGNTQYVRGAEFEYTVVTDAIRLADLTLDAMSRSDGEPHPK